MLTKDLLQFTHRKGRVTPTFIQESRPNLVRLADDLCHVMRSSAGKTSEEILEALDTVQTQESCAGGLCKILLDRCRYEEPNDKVVTNRWEILRTAQDLRDDGQWDGPDDYATIVATRCGADNAHALRQSLFADHPDERRCEQYEDVSSTDLLSEYNRATLQTMFIFADEVSITVKNASVTEKRAFFRQLKFHSLMSEVAVDPEDSTFTVYLSGPLRLFQKSTTYGLRLAKFIPNLLHLKSWELDAVVQLKNKRLSLKLDSTIDVKPRGRGLLGYVPEEFTEVMRIFNDADHDWKMEISGDFVNIGKQSYCFPDFDLVKGKRRVHVELFHPWHKGQLAGRLKALENYKFKNLVVAVDKSLAKDKETSSLLSESPWFQKFGFQFVQFPTPNQILKAVET